jgi:hypothetical protein
MPQSPYRSNEERIAAAKDRADYLDILDLASECTEDEFRNIHYVFRTPVATIELFDSALDGDVSIRIFVSGQEAPLVKLDLVDCLDVKAINDKRGRYLEFVGQLQIGEWSRGSDRKTTGFRLYFEPSVCLEPFFVSGA